MLDGLLLALFGFTSDAIILEPPEDTPYGPKKGRFKLSQAFTARGEAEREQVEALLPLGFCYRQLNEFVTWANAASDITNFILKSSQPVGGPWEQTASREGTGGGLGNASRAGRGNGDVAGDVDREERGGHVQGVYGRALATGVSELLATYRTAVIDAEHEVIATQRPMVSTVARHLDRFSVVLPAVHSLVQRVVSEGLWTGGLLKLLYEQSLCGIPALQACMERLVWHCQSTLCRYLHLWMVHGVLTDSRDQFFIARVTEGRGQEPGGTTKWASRAGEWSKDYSVRQDLLPPYISPKTADSILFIGQAMKILRSPSESFMAQMRSGQSGRTSRATTRQGSGIATPKLTEFLELPRSNFQLPEIIPQTQADEISRSILRLEHMAVLNGMAIEDIVRNAHSIVATHLWQLVVIHADAGATLGALKDYFLLGKGDFFQFFMELSRELTALPPPLGETDRGEWQLQTCFLQAAAEAGCDEDPHFARLTLRMLDAPPPPPKTAILSGSASVPPLTRLPAMKGLRVSLPIDNPGDAATPVTTGRGIRGLKGLSGRLAGGGERVTSVLGGTPALGGGGGGRRESSSAAEGLGNGSGRETAGVATPSGKEGGGLGVGVGVGMGGRREIPGMKTEGEVQTSAWDEVALSCQVEWPLQLLITKEALAVYNEMFRYLLRIRRVAVELESAWKAAMEGDRRERVGGRQTRAQRAQRFPLWALRHAMTHLVGNLQLYIQVDVVEVQWAVLQEKVGASRDFTQVAEYHEGYLKALIDQSCARIYPVRNLINAILVVCLDTARMVVKKGGTCDPMVVRMKTEAFKRQSRKLITILKNRQVADRVEAPFLEQMVFRLNYNNYFELRRKGNEGSF